MKRLLCLIIVPIILLSFCACGSSSSDYSSDYNSDSDYDYDKGYGYTEPTPGESLSDYIQRQDPELYDSIDERLQNLDN